MASSDALKLDRSTTGPSANTRDARGEISHGNRGRADEPIAALLKEGRKFPPPENFGKTARVKGRRIYQDARKNPVAFWEGQAKELRWMKPWRKALEWKLP